MAQNLIIPSKDNKVVFVFGGVDLTLATNITLQLGAESFSTTGGTPKLTVSSATELSCDLSGTTEKGRIFATVTYFDGASVNGTDITSRELSNAGQIIVAIGTQLIIEDGTVVANANSFATDAELKSYADLRGISLPATQPERESLLIMAMDYLKSRENSLSGTRSSSTQTLPYPRAGVYVFNNPIASNIIPAQAKVAQLEASIAAKDIVLLNNASITGVKSEKLGTMSTEYFEGGAWAITRLESVDAALQPLLRSGGLGLGRTSRSL